MVLTRVKHWLKAQRWLQPSLLALWLVGFWLRHKLRVAVYAYHHPRCYIKQKPWLRVLIPLLRCVENALHALPGLPRRAVPFLYHLYWFHKVGRHRLGVPVEVQGPRRIVMLVCSNLSVDPRVRQEAIALARGGFHVTVICPAWSMDVQQCAKSLNWGNNISFRILPLRAARFICAWPYLFGREMYQAALAEPAWAYHAHDLDTAFMALLAAARKRVACICDFHEWYSENVSFDIWTKTYRPHSFFKRRLYQAMENLVIHHAHRVVTVCNSIRDLLEKTYRAPRPIGVVRNIPSIAHQAESACEDLRKKLDIPDGRKIVLYQGGIGPSRNLEPVIRAMPFAPNVALVIRGPGYETHGTAYHELAMRLGVKDQVFCLPHVAAARVVVEAQAADIGLWSLLSHVGLNFKLALPNKVFEYLAAGLPLIVADLPEVRALIDTYGVGVCFDPDDSRSIATAMNLLADDARLYATCRANIPAALKKLNADEEWNKLVNLYYHLGETTEDVTRLARAG